MSFYPPGVQPDYDELCEGIQSNPDGVGAAIVLEDGTLWVKKAVGFKTTEKTQSKVKADSWYTTTVMNVEACYDLAAEFCALRKENPSGPAMFHSRFATGGVEDTRGCHPFGVNIKGQVEDSTIVAHNGVLFSPAHGDWRSDTRIFAEMVLRDVLKGTHQQSAERRKILAKAVPASLWSKNGVRKVENYLGGGNKIAIITTDPEVMSPSARAKGAPWEYRIYNADQGIWTKDGAWHSNSGYMTPRNYAKASIHDGDWEPGATWNYQTGAWERTDGAGTKGYTPTWLKDAPDTCEGIGAQFRDAEDVVLECTMCGSRQVSTITLICGACDTCQDCYDISADCQCFNPHGSSSRARDDDGEEGDGWTPDWYSQLMQRPMALMPGSSDDGSIEPPMICSSEEKLAAWEAFQSGELTYGDYLEIAHGEDYACSCNDWCGESGCLPDDSITFEVTDEPYVPEVGDKVRVGPREYPKGVSTVIQTTGNMVTIQTESKTTTVSDTIDGWRQSGLILVMRPSGTGDVKSDAQKVRDGIPLTQAELDEVADEIAAEVLARTDDDRTSYEKMVELRESQATS